MNFTSGSEEVLSVALLLDWSNCPKVLLCVAALAVSDSLFRRLSEVELRSSGGDGFFHALVAGCCGYAAGSDDDDDDRSRGGSRRSKRRPSHHGVSRDSVSSTLDVASSGVTSRDCRHLAQPALQLCFAAAVLSASCVVHTVRVAFQCAHAGLAHDAQRICLDRRSPGLAGVMSRRR